MNYDQNLDYNDPPMDEQEDLWLEDLKALLDDTPGSASGRGPVQRVPQPRGPEYQPAPQRQIPPQNRPQRGPGGRGIPQNNSGTGSQWQDLPQWNPQNVAQMPRSDWQPMTYPSMEEEEAPRRKKGLGAVITLSIIIVLEILAIAWVGYTWMQWMQ